MSDSTHPPLRIRAQLALAGKCALTNSQHRQAWSRVESTFHDSAKKGDKAFEVHHRIEKARERYFMALIDGASPAECEASAILVTLA